MSNLEEFELTKMQKVSANLIAGIVIVTVGVFLLLCGTGIIPVHITSVLAPALLFGVGLVFLITGLIQKNTVSLWLSVVFFVIGLVEILVNFTALNHAGLYPIYIAIPAVSSLFTAIYTRDFKPHLGVFAVFGISAAIFSLQSSGAVGFGVVIPVFVVFAGALILVATLRIAKGGDDNGGEKREQHETNNAGEKSE